MADGTVIIDTRLDNKKLEKDLDKTSRKIESLEQKIAQKETARAPIVEALQEANKEAVEAYNNVERLQNRLAASQAATTSGTLGPDAYITELENQKQIKAELKEQEKILKQKEAVAQRLTRQDEAAVRYIEQQTAELERQKGKAGELQQQLEEAQRFSPLNNAMSGVEKKIDKLGKKLAGLAKRVFVFTLITSALRDVRTYLSAVISQSSEASAAVARLKGALLTMAQPILEVVIPAFVALINVLTRIISAIAGLTSMLFGKTIKQSKDAAKSLYNEASGIKAVGDAAKKASGFLAAFDEVNQVQDDDASSGSSGASAKTPDFSFDTSKMEADFEKILGWVKLIGAAIGAWKVWTLTGSLSKSLRAFLGLLLAITGAIEMVKGAWDAWQNGLSVDNMNQMLIGMLELVAGLAIAFGPVAAAVGMIAGGLVLLATAFHDAAENGWNFQNMLLTIAGIMAAGCGIAILTGSWIPMLIAAIVSLLTMLAIQTGHGEELINGIKDVCQGFLKFITGIFCGDIEKALDGISQMFNGFKGIIGAVFSGVEDTINSFLTWLDEKTGGHLHGIIELAKGYVSGLVGDVKNYLNGMMDAIEQIFKGIVQFVAGVFTNDWNRAWEGVKNILKGILNSIISLAELTVNRLIKGINALGFGPVPDWVPVVGGKSFRLNMQTIKLPRLASGAVIPPNREFAAILGDQTNGNNLEAPESLIRKIVREESGGADSQTVALLQAILAAVQDGKVLMVDKRVLGKVAAAAMGNASRTSGAAVIPL